MTLGRCAHVLLHFIERSTDAKRDPSADLSYPLQEQLLQKDGSVKLRKAAAKESDEGFVASLTNSLETSAETKPRLEKDAPFERQPKQNQPFVEEPREQRAESLADGGVKVIHPLFRVSSPASLATRRNRSTHVCLPACLPACLPGLPGWLAVCLPQFLLLQVAKKVGSPLFQKKRSQH